MRISLWPIFQLCGKLFVALSSCAEFYLFLRALALVCICSSIHPPSHIFVTHDEAIKQSATNQAMNKLDICVSKKTNEAMCSKLDR